MNPLKKLAGDTALYGLGTIVPRLFNFLLLPLHTAVFNPGQYGIITYLYAFAAFLNVVYLWGMETAYFRFATRPEAHQQRAFNTAQTLVLLVSTLLSVGIILFARPLAEAMKMEGGVPYLYWLAGILWIDAALAIPFARLRLERKAQRFALIKILNIALLVLLNIYFLWLQQHREVVYVLQANLLANASQLLFFVPVLFSWRPLIERAITPAMLKYATPIMLTGLAGMTNEMFSRITLGWWLPDHFYPGRDANYALGVFGACYKYAVFMNLAIQAFRFAAEPFFFSNAANRNAPELFARINHYFVIVCSAIVVMVGVNLDALRFLLGSEQYFEGLIVVPILLLAYLFLGVYYNFSVWFKIMDKTYFGTLFTAAGAFITVMFNYLLIPLMGYMGSALAALICYMSMTLACYLFGQKYFPIPYALRKTLLHISIAVGYTYLVTWPVVDNLWLNHLYHLAATAIYLAGVWLSERPALR